MDFQAARELVLARLAEMETDMNEFGSALPNFQNRKIHHLVIIEHMTQEHEFGWVFFYDTEEHQRTKDHAASLVGNAPLIVDRLDGCMYVTGTAKPVNFYISEYKQGKRVPA
jgi:hypothetical protein